MPNSDPAEQQPDGQPTPTPTIPIIGCKLPVSKGTGQDKIWIQAEVLSCRFPDSTTPQYYVHFDLYNKRLDEWVTLDRMDIEKMKLPSPKKKPIHPKVAKLKKTPAGDKKRKRGTLTGAAAAAVAASIASAVAAEESASTSAAATGADQQEGEEGGDGGEEGDSGSTNNPNATFSKEKELEKLRTSGSMTQSQTEISRLKNINRICMGKSIIDTWYFSPYPEEFTRLDVMFICEFCLEPVGTELMLERHRKKCQIRHPPGNEIYRCGSLSFFELDGRKQRHYCRNLCLISKLFLDHKTLYYEVDPFLYYIMTRSDETGMHVLGYFSKEKQSAEDYNVACILTLPQYQRKGYGKLLIAFSYELSLIEKKTGSPEKPLSDLGLLSYRSYWADVIIDKLMNSPNGEMSIHEISEKTSITTDDLMNTIQAMDMIKFYKSNFVLYLDEKSVAQYEKAMAKKREKIDPACIEWTPPKFLPNQLNFL